MKKPKTHILVCQNIDCQQKGSEAILNGLQEELAGDEEMKVGPYLCFGTCEQAPNVVIYPRRQWYSEVEVSDVPEIAAALRHGTTVVRLCDKVDRRNQEFIYGLLELGFG